MNYGGYGSQVQHPITTGIANNVPMLSAEQVRQIQLQHQTLQAKRQAPEAELQQAMRAEQARGLSCMTVEQIRREGQASVRYVTDSAYQVIGDIVIWMGKNGYSLPLGPSADLRQLLASIAEQSADRARLEMSELAQRHALEQQTMAHPRESIADEWMRRR